jgi:uncharacterized protein YegP (UPF0339 family)
MKAEIYLARDGWRWRLKARNGRIVADSGEAYTRERDAVKAFNRMACQVRTIR